MIFLYGAIIICALISAYFIGRSKGYSEGNTDGYIHGLNQGSIDGIFLAQQIDYWKNIALKAPVHTLQEKKKAGRPKKV